jgi:hypothetical protein
MMTIKDEEYYEENVENGNRIHIDVDGTCGDDEFGFSFEPRGVDPAEDERIRHWKESPYAVGKVDTTWRAGMRCCCDHENAGPRSPCNTVFTSWICGTLGAGRVGNMVVLWQHDQLVEQRNGDTIKRPQIDVVLGPYWPIALFVTLPAIIGISLLTALRVIKNQHPALIGIWVFITVCLLLALLCVSCRDPGIMMRVQDPPISETEHFTWNDQAMTFRPRKAKYDKDCGVVIEELDHVW